MVAVVAAVVASAVAAVVVAADAAALEILPARLQADSVLTTLP